MSLRDARAKKERKRSTRARAAPIPSARCRPVLWISSSPSWPRGPRRRGRGPQERGKRAAPSLLSSPQDRAAHLDLILRAAQNKTGVGYRDGLTKLNVEYLHLILKLKKHWGAFELDLALSPSPHSALAPAPVRACDCVRWLYTMTSRPSALRLFVLIPSFSLHSALPLLHLAVRLSSTPSPPPPAAITSSPSARSGESR
jgi:hypothetical protein